MRACEAPAARWGWVRVSGKWEELRLGLGLGFGRLKLDEAGLARRVTPARKPRGVVEKPAWLRFWFWLG